MKMNKEEILGMLVALENFLDRERPMMQDEMAALSHHAPYRKDGGLLSGSEES